MYLLKTLSETVAETVAEATEQTQAAPDTDMVSMISILLVIMMLGLGVYCIYTFFRLHREYYLFPNKFLYPGDCPPENCTDVSGFIEFILPRILIFGIAVILCGIGYGMLDLVWKVKHIAVFICSLVIPLGIFAWYIYVQRKAANLFW